MAELADHMPPLDISVEELKRWGSLWLGESNPETGKSKRPECFDRQQFADTLYPHYLNRYKGLPPHD